MANNENLKPIRSKSEAREKGRNGGIASGAARRKKRTMREAAETFLNLPVKDQSLLEKLRPLGIKKGDMDYQTVMIVSLFQQVLKGDIKAAEFLRDTLGGIESSGSPCDDPPDGELNYEDTVIYLPQIEEDDEA